METLEVKKGLFMQINDPIDDIYILEQGIAEIFLTIDGIDIVFERLFRGSVINYKSAFQNKDS